MDFKNNKLVYILREKDMNDLKKEEKFSVNIYDFDKKDNMALGILHKSIRLLRFFKKDLIYV